MRHFTRNHDGQFRRITAAGLGLLLLLMTLPGCVARHMPDWSKVQAVAPETETEVHLYKDKSPGGERKIKGRFLSAADNSIKLQLKNGSTRTFQKSDVRKVLTLRDLGHRWPGWVALGSILLLLPVPEDSVLLRPIIALPIAAGAFYGSRMGGIYEVPPKHRDWFPQGTNSSEAGEKKPENSK